jgi:signal transduction histidine kinase
MSSPLNVLLVEDDDGDARLLALLLAETDLRAELVRARSLAELAPLVEGNRFDVALVDLHLPDSQGLDTVLHVRANLADTPLIVLTGTSGEQLPELALQQGVQDFLSKNGLEPPVVARAIRYALDRHTAVRRLQEIIALQDQLREQLEETNRLKSEFVTVASHELRTPITVIVGAMTTLDRILPVDQWPPNATRLWAAAKRHSRRLSDLVGDLLLASALDHEDPAPPARFLLAEAIDEGIEASTIDPGSVKLIVPRGLEVTGVRGHLVRVIANLLTNAERYGAPPIEVVGTRTVDAVRLEVRDHGVGVDPDFLPYLFEPFRQAEPGSRGGLGLGLQIVERLVKDDGGSIRYEPAAPTGACFVIEYPDRNSP